MEQANKTKNHEDISSHLDCMVIPHFKVSIYVDICWVMVETQIRQFGIRDLIRALRADGFKNDSILIEAV